MAEACSCTLCRERNGEQVERMVVTYEQAVPRKRGERCPCRHCEALRAEGAP